MTGAFVISVLAGVTLATLIALVSARLARSTSAASRHALLTAACVIVLVLPMFALVSPTLHLALPIGPASAQEQVGPATYEPAEVDASSARVPSPIQSSSSVPSIVTTHTWMSVATLLTVAWLAGALICLVPLLTALRQMGMLRLTARSWRLGQTAAEGLLRRSWRQSSVNVAVHPSIASPAAFGVRRAMVLLPEEAQRWSEVELRRALVHELEHVRRRDWLTQCLGRVACAAYWFHPLVWAVQRRLILNAECACDDAVIAQSGTDDASAEAYADQLVNLARRIAVGTRQPMLAMANRRDLAARVRALLDRRTRRGRASTSLVAAVCAISAVMVGAVSGLRVTMMPQGDPVLSADTPRFDVASIRPCESAPPVPVGRAGGAGQVVSSPGRLHIECAPVLGTDGLIRMAHAKFANGQALRYWAFLPINGGPAWAKSARFTIDASAGGSPSVEMMKGPMLQALLADAFQLKTHRETHNVPIYALTVGAGGPKLHPFDGRCKPIDFTRPIPNQLEADGACVFVGANNKWDAPGMTVDDFIKTALSDLDRPVVNRTGLAGRFDFTLDISGSDASSGYETSLAAALRQQLDLVLSPATGPEDFLIVDSVEQPPVSWVKKPAAVSQRFEAATIRPCKDDEPPRGAGAGPRSGQGGFPTVSPGRFTIDCGTLERLISNAYVLNGEPLPNNIARIGDVSWWTGGPEWIRYDKFTIEATAPGVTDRAVLLGPMLRTLLEERFKLTLHRATKEVPMYTLTVAKGGLKISPMSEGGCLDPDQADRTDQRAFANAILDGTGKPLCGGMTMMGGSARSVWVIGGTTLRNFAGTLTTAMDHFVIDRTNGGDTKYNIRLVFSPDEHMPGADKRNPRTNFAPPDEPRDAPTIFAAVEQELGLTLDATKGPQGYLVIDHVERLAPDGSVVVPARAKGPGR